MEFFDTLWQGFGQTLSRAPLFLALVTAGLWADRQFGKSEEVRLCLALLIGLVAGVALTHFGVQLDYPPYFSAAPLIILGVIAALQSPRVNSSIALIVLLVLGIYLGLGQAWQGSALATTLGVAAGAVTSLAAGIGLGTLLSAVIGGFGLRVIGAGVAVVGVLMVIDRL